jgi:hypothetical protein
MKVTDKAKGQSPVNKRNRFVLDGCMLRRGTNESKSRTAPATEQFGAMPGLYFLK